MAKTPQVKHDIKEKLTQSATGATGGEGSRNHVQVIANSGVASVLILLHLWALKTDGRYEDKDLCWNGSSDVLVIGIVAYATRVSPASMVLTPPGIMPQSLQIPSLPNSVSFRSPSHDS